MRGYVFFGDLKGFGEYLHGLEFLPRELSALQYSYLIDFIEKMNVSESFIRQRVLQGIALNRTPGFHYVGNFLRPSFDHVSAQNVSMSLNVGPHNADRDGNVNFGALLVFADLAIAANVRAAHDRAARLATVNMHMHFTGAPMTGLIEAKTTVHGYLVDSLGRQGAGSISLTAGGQPVGFGTGAFMVLDPPKGVALYPMELRSAKDPEVPALAVEALEPDELLIWQRAEAALQSNENQSFVNRFFGFDTRAEDFGAVGELKNGAHVGNRVGHLQGGITMGLGMATAERALNKDWRVSAVSAWFISPGEGPVISARSTILHRGRLTAVVRTEITGLNNRRTMEMVTTHAKKMS